MPAIVLITPLYPLCALWFRFSNFFRSLAISIDFGNVFQSVLSLLISGRFLVPDLLRVAVRRIAPLFSADCAVNILLYAAKISPCGPVPQVRADSGGPCFV